MRKNLVLRSLVVLALLAAATPLSAAPLTPGNLVIYRVGDGTASLASSGTAVFLDEYTTAGTLVQSISVPTTTVGAQRRLVCSGTATSEGYLTRSTDGLYVVFSGYDAAPATASITSSTSATVPRVIGRLAANGTLDTTTALTDAISGGNPRSAASTNGTDLWLSGTSSGGGIRYATLGATTSTSLATTPTNLRALGIFGGQLYTTSQSGAFRLATIGTGTPTTAGQTITNLPGFPTATGSPYGFFFADLDAGVAGLDTVYVADDGGTIQKYSLVAGNWTANGTIALATARGLTGTVSGSTVTLYATARTTLRTLTDTSGYNATITGTVTTLATAGTNTAMQGVAFVPVSTLPGLAINNVSLNEGNAGTTSFTFTVSLSAPAGAGGVTFDIATADDTATQPSDYTLNSLTGQTIPSGSSTYSFTVLVNGDTTPETNETFFVNVTNVTGATVTDGQGQGTIVNDDAAPNLTVNDVSLNEGNASTTTFSFTVSLSAPAPAGGVTFDIATADNTATQPGDYTQKTLTAQTIPGGASGLGFNVLVNGDTTPETDETFFVNVTNIVNGIGVDTQGLGTIVNDDITFIHDVQGSGAATPIPGSTVTVEGIVVANFQGTSKLSGFFLEEEDADYDANPATSEGIFIFCSACPTAVTEGNKVKATGTVSEFFNMTEITATTAGSVVITNPGNNFALVTPSPIDLPVAGVVDDFYEAREGMKVTFVDTLTVSEYFELGRFGQVILYEGGRPRQFTEANAPSVAGNAAWADTLSRRKVILDDDNNAQQWYLTTSTPAGPADGLQYVYHPRANGGFSTGTQGTDFFRGGDLVNGLTGVLHWDFPGSGANAWRIRPTSANPAAFTVANPRPATPPAAGGAIKAVGMNLLNYFTTIDTTSSNSTGPCAPSGTLDCRGADSVAELNRQRERASIVICTLNADVHGFAELENTTPSASITDLLGAVNTLCGGAHPYAFVNTGGTLGTDAIRGQLIYRTGIVSPVGAPLSDLDPIHSRPPTAQTFDVVDATNPAFGQRFTAVINHFKSKGCGGATGTDLDALDGQGCFNATRTAQAARLLTWISGTVLPAAGDPDVLLLGDFNAYAKEDPINTLIAGGYTDLETLFQGANAYSYLFDGQLGHLDYGFASASLLPQVTGADAWHINADEVGLFDYNDEVKDTGEATFEEKPDGSALVPPRVVFQAGTPYRASDHDPILVGLFPVADLAITKTDGVTTATPGGSTTYTITASNAGPSSTTATVADTFPATLTCTWTCVGAGGGTCTAAGSGNISDAVTLPSGGSVTYTASCSISAAATGSLSNTATVTSAASSDPTPANNSATDTDTLTPQANLGITKTDGVTSATPGGSTTYTITASNAGPSNAPGSSVSDTFPASLTCTWTCVGAGGAGVVTEFVTGSTGAQPLNIAAGSDGNLWFTESNGNRIGRITPAGVVTLFSAGITAGAQPSDIASGPDGNLWFTEALGHQIGRITPAGVVTEFSAGITAFASPRGITAGPDGNLWFTEAFGNRIGRITTAGVVTEFSAGITAAAQLQDIASGPDGNLWFTEVTGNQIGRISPTGTVTEFSAGISAGASPRQIAAGPDGNLWFTESSGNRIARITPAGVVTEFSVGISPTAIPDGITAGPDGNLWFTEFNGNRIGRITTAGVVTEFSTGITAGAQPSGITAGPDGNLWFTESGVDRIARITANSGTCTASGSGNIVDTVNLPVGGSVTYTASCTVAASATGSLVNTATVATGTSVTDPTPGNNSATDTDTLSPSANVGITKSDGLTSATPGGSTTYTITASNAGPSNTTGTVADTFPATLTCTWTCVGAGGGTCTASGSGNINDSVTLPSGGSVTYTASCSISAAATGSLSNTATVTGAATDPTPGNNSATDTDTLSPSANLGITKTDGVTSATPGGSVTYTIVASNAGPSSAPGSSVADTFPASLTCTWTCVGAGGGTCTASGSGNIADTVNLPSGGSVTYTASCTISAAATGSLANTATVTAATSITDPTPGNNSATDTDTLGASADLSITKTDGVTSVLPGGSTTYTITASNAGPSNAPGSSVSDTFPASLTCTWTCVGAGGGTCTAAGSGNISDTVNLPSGGSVTYTASCTISPSATGSLVNTATVATAGGVTDPTPGNNSATDTDAVTPTAAVSGTKTASGPFTVGSTLVYTVVLTNSGTGAQADNPGDEFTDVLPATLALVSASATSGTAVATTGTNTVTWNGAIPASGTVTITINATILASAGGAFVSNQGTIAYDADANGSNERTAPTDDPGVAGNANPTSIAVAGQSVVEIPTLGEFGLLALAGLLAAGGVRRLRRRGRQ